MPNQSQPDQTPLKAALRKTFLSHPESIGESYFEHMRAAMGYSASLSLAAAAALIHALVPCLFKHTTRNKIESLHCKLQGRTPVADCAED